MAINPVQVSFHGVPHSDALDTHIRERVAWLEQFYSGVVSCRVFVELPHRHRDDGRHFHVSIELTVPGHAPLVVSREPSLHRSLQRTETAAHRKATEIEGAHRYARAAVNEAFDAARRRLQDFAREQRGDVKTHAAPAP
jgi:hypothetical protein